jgi:hypothetical protein
MERAKELNQEATTISFPGTFEILFSRSLTIAKKDAHPRRGSKERDYI